LSVFAGKVIQGSCDVGEVGDKGTIEVAESKKAANFFYSGGCRPVSDSLDFDRVHTDLAIANDYSQVFNLLLMEVTFLWFEEKVMLCQFIQDMGNVEAVKDIIICGSNDNIIHVNLDPSFLDFVLEYFIHHCLEGGWRVMQAKEHYCRLKQSFTSFECSFPLVTFFESDVVISPMNIELGE
jgi:hypothetical protein